MNQTETVVLGGGLAGSMVALELARHGRQTTLFERSKGAHHKVCGEFLSGEAIHYLVRHGVDVSSLGAVALRSVRLVLDTTVIEQELPFPAYSLSRLLLDEELLRRAALAGADVRRGCTVEGLQQTAAGWSVEIRDDAPVQSTHAFLATGKHDVRGWPRPAGTHHGLVAFKMYWQLNASQHAALADAVELVLFPGGYAGLQPVEGGRVNLCLLVTADRLRDAGANWGGLLAYLLHRCAHLRMRLTGAVQLLAAPLTAFHIPYGHMQGAALNGLWRVGDQAAVIPSFCGDGMAIALHSGATAAHHFLIGSTPETYRKQLRDQLGRGLALATRLSRLMIAFPAAAQAARVAPGLLSYIARGTRIPDSALL